MGPRSRLRSFPVLLLLLSVLASGCTTYSRSYGSHHRYGGYDEWYRYDHDPRVRCDRYGRCMRYEPHRGNWVPYHHGRPGTVYVPVYRDRHDHDHDRDRRHHRDHDRDRDRDRNRDRDDDRDRDRRRAEEHRRAEERRVVESQSSGRTEMRRKERYEGRVKSAQKQERRETEEDLEALD